MKKIILSSICTMLLFGCQQTTDTSKNSASGNSANVANTNVASNSNTGEISEAEKIPSEPGTRERVVEATKKLQEVKFWTAKIDSKELPQVKAEMQYLAPDRYYIKQPGNELIVIGKDGYIKNESGKWEKSQDNYSEMLNVNAKQLAESLMKNLQGVKVAGEEKLNGKDTIVYSYELPSPAKNIGTTRVWITKADNMLLQTEVENIAGGQKPKIVTRYDYETPVKIEVPTAN